MTSQKTAPPPVGARLRAAHFHVQHPGQPDAQGLIRDRFDAVIGIDDNYTVPPGTEGTVRLIDGLGQVHVDWDNGSSIALVPGFDEWDLI